MSRVIQITVSPSGSLFALTDGGDIYVTDHRSPWQKVDGPIPPRFSDPAEYTPAPCQAWSRGDKVYHDPSSPGSFFMGDKQCEDRLNREHVIPGLIAMQMPERPRRPTSIGSDGNYIPPLGD